MKKVKILFALVAVLFSCNAIAQTVLSSGTVSANDITIAEDGTATLTVSTAGSTGTGQGFSFILTLPEGIVPDSIDTDTNVSTGVTRTIYDTTFGSLVRRNGGLLNINTREDGSYLVAAAPSSSLNGNDGTLISIVLRNKGAKEGSYSGSITDFRIVQQGGGMTNTYIVYGLSTTFNVSVTGATGINGITVDKLAKEGKVYNFQGQRVGKVSQRGIYIVNGKKVVVK